MRAGPRLIVSGNVRDGVVVLDDDLALPEGARVGVGVAVADVDPELAAEMRAWDQASDEAWGMID